MKLARYLAFALFVGVVGFVFAPFASSQHRGDTTTTILAGTNLMVRTSQPIDISQNDYEVYRGFVDQDVRGDDTHLAIPRGSDVELIARPAPNGDMVLDVDSVTVNGQRYAIETRAKRFEGQGNDLIGNIIGAIQGGTYQGRSIRIPRDSTINFRIVRPMTVGIADRGVDRNGRHYHDWYRDYYGR